MKITNRKYFEFSLNFSKFLLKFSKILKIFIKFLQKIIRNIFEHMHYEKILFKKYNI